MTMTKKNKSHSPLGSSFDTFLQEEGFHKEVTLAAAKRVLSMQIAREMVRQHLSKTQMARRMHTSRSSLERLLDPDNKAVTLQTLDKAARSLGRRIAVALV